MSSLLRARVAWRHVASHHTPTVYVLFAPNESFRGGHSLPIPSMGLAWSGSLFSTSTTKNNSGPYNQTFSARTLPTISLTNTNQSITSTRNKSTLGKNLATPPDSTSKKHQDGSKIKGVGGKLTQIHKQTMVQALPYGDVESHQKVSFSKIFSILTPEWKMMSASFGAIIVSAGATMAFPNAIGRIIDLLSLSPTPDVMSQIQMISLGMVGVFSVGAVATFAHTALLEIVGQKVGADLRKKLFERLMSQEVSFFDNNRAGELANRLSTDVHEVAEHLVENVASFLEHGVKCVSAVGAMVLISPLLTLYSSTVIPAVVGGAIFYGRFIRTLSAKHLDALATSTHVATERFSGIATVFSFGQTRMESERYSHVIEKAYGLARRVAMFQSAFLGSSYFVGNAALLGVLWCGGGMVFEGTLTAGQLASFCMYAGHLAESVGEITGSASGFLRAQGSGSRLFALLDKEPWKPTGTVKLPDDFTRRIRFEGVSFSYPSSPHTSILRHLDLTIEQGELLAVTGRSGCGKSSLASLVQRLYEPTEGRITIDGVDIRDLDIDWLRSQIGSVRQEPILFAASVRENIAYGKPDATQEEIEEAAIKANVHDFIAALPQGYDTVVGERGASLSGGQKQRIAIARALLTKPKILILDEATSALDTSSERLIFESLDSLRVNHGVTIIMIAHHLSTLAASDRVIVLDEGLLVQNGNFHELSGSGIMQTLVAAGSVHPPHSSCPPDPLPQERVARVETSRHMS